MKSYEKKIVFKTLILLLSLAIFNINSFSLIMGNWPPFEYCKDCENKSTINNYVIEGCGYFLNAYSDILILLNRVELSDLHGIDYEELQRIVDNAISNMNNARAAYSSLVEMAESTPYVPGSIQKLKDFDYDGFQREHQLNGIIFKDVVSYLEKGEVRGIYYRLLVDIENILNNLYSIKSAINSGKFPEIPALWKLNQLCSGTILFGQYAAEVFYNIK